MSIYSFINVFVNDAGKNAMMNQKNPFFPVGSVVVKQKMRSADSKSVELSTVMVKRESGYNPENGDWEYAVINAEVTKTESEGKIEHCQKCHAENKQNDYVFRLGYFSEKLYNKLKP